MIDPWAGLVLSTDGLTAKYCELNRFGAWVHQPANTVSNVAFAIAGARILLERDTTGRLGSAPRWVFGISLIALALGSGLFHASNTLLAQRLDMGGTYAVVLALLFFTISLERPTAEASRWLVGLLATDALFVAFDLFRQGAWLLPVLLGVLLSAAIAHHLRRGAGHDGRYLVRAVVGLSVAAACWILDVQKIGCAPESYLQLHALWHVATAFSASELYLYLDRVEPAPQPSPSLLASA